MRVLILMGSPRLHGNTAELCRHFSEELESLGAEVKYTELEKLTINPCRECYACQNVSGEYGCAQKDDMAGIAEDIRRSDVIVFATPIFAWFCTAKMKAVLDRHYGLNKYYGTAKGSLWAGKKAAIIATHGYEAGYATEPFETALRRLCVHSNLVYAGIYSVRDEDDLASFRTPEAVEGVKAFARKLIGESDT